MIHTRDIEHGENRFLFMVTRAGTVKRLPVITLKNLRSNGIRALRMEAVSYTHLLRQRRNVYHAR